MTTETVTVERVSRFGFMVNGDWVKGDKYATPKVELTGYTVGQELVVTYNDKGYAVKIEGARKGSSTPATSEASPMVATTYKASDKSKEIARSTAVKAVFGSPILYDIYKGEDNKDSVATELMALVKQVATYITTGEFGGGTIPTVEAVVEETAKETENVAI